jgi:hypothetical protein
MGYSFTAAPDPSAPVSNAATRSSPFTNTTLFVSDSTGHNVGFTTSATALASTRMGGFMIAEQRLFVVEDTGSVLPSLYCAFPSKENPKIWELKWNVANDVPERANKVPVTLRSNKFPYKEPERANNMETRCRTRAAITRE